ncbi:DNA polymerase III subunit gamma/tau [Clostridium perfringens]|nr:DNA polymerase III subunit gamma/tau [Clostridium perfringens]EGT0014423.1 DNA polymerase III subunit gamma/tau [Clostridium perfringens]
MLYEKYRPNTFESVIGQGENAEILKKQVASKKIAHSYLLYGERGSGKTTTARILAKAINCLSPINGEPCGKCANCIAIEEKKAIDVVEIDAASNNGVDNIRNIIDDMKYAPTSMKYKVYIIDEAHMLSKAASNAFLKTLEEPPEYGVFILCTTEQTALPITILSRCQRYTFKHIDVKDIFNRINFIATQEGYNPSDKEKILYLISKMADGAVRDAICILEQVINGNITDYNEVVKLLGVVSNRTLFELLATLKKSNNKRAIDLIYKALEQTDAEKLITNIIALVRAILLIKSNASIDLIKMSDEDINIAKSAAQCFETSELFNIIEAFNKVYFDVKNSNFKGVLIEMTVLKLIEDLSISVKPINNIDINGLRAEIESELKAKYSDQVNNLRVEIESELKAKYSNQAQNTDKLKATLEKEIEEKYKRQFQAAIPQIEKNIREKIQKEVEETQNSNFERAEKVKLQKAIDLSKQKLIEECNNLAKNNPSFSSLAQAFAKSGFIKENGTDRIRICANSTFSKIISAAFENSALKEMCCKFFIIENHKYSLVLS